MGDGQGRGKAESPEGPGIPTSQHQVARKQGRASGWSSPKTQMNFSIIGIWVKIHIQIIH